MNCKRCDGTGIEPDMRQLGQELKGLRLNADITLRRMAQMLRLSPSFISQLEKGDRRWKPYWIRKYHTITKDNTP